MIRGFGVINVEPLGEAMIAPGWNPAFLPAQSFQPAYMPAGQTSTLPQWLYAAPSFASQLAQLLGGSVVQGPPPGDYQAAAGTSLPETSFVSVDGQQILPGNLFQPGSFLSFENLCTAENYLTNSISGSEFGASCGGYATSTANPLVTPTGVPAVQAPVAAPVIAAPVIPITPAAIVPPPAGNVVTKTAGASVGSNGAGPVPTVPAAPVSSDIIVGGFDLSTVPWYVWAALGGGALFLMMGKH